MGFKLPGKSITSGTSAHRSALKMVAEQRAASALKATASPVKKDWATAKKNDPNLDQYVSDRKGMEKGSSEYGANQYKINKAYYGEETAKRLQDKYNKKYSITPKADVEDVKDDSGTENVKPTKVEVIKKKGEDKKSNLQTKIKEVDENVSKKTAKVEKKEARKTYGRGSKEHLEAKAKHLKAKEADRTGEEGGKKQKLFKKLSSKINKRRQKRVAEKLAEKNKAKGGETEGTATKGAATKGAEKEVMEEASSSMSVSPTTDKKKSTKKMTKTFKKTTPTESEEKYGTYPPDEISSLDMSKG
tara:strand:+ start:2026 stop:2931 length:906 start_codon:yes stop_codon:yes gene_type:complete